MHLSSNALNLICMQGHSIQKAVLCDVWFADNIDQIADTVKKLQPVREHLKALFKNFQMDIIERRIEALTIKI